MHGTYEVIDLNGRLVESGAVSEGTQTLRIDCNTWAPGMYLVKMSNESGTWQSTFMKQ